MEVLSWVSCSCVIDYIPTTSSYYIRGMAQFKVKLYVEERKTNLMSLAILFHFLCAQHISDINISIIRRLRLCCC